MYRLVGQNKMLYTLLLMIKTSAYHASLPSDPPLDSDGHLHPTGILDNPQVLRAHTQQLHEQEKQQQIQQQTHTTGYPRIDHQYGNLEFETQEPHNYSQLCSTNNDSLAKMVGFDYQMCETLFSHFLCEIFSGLH